MSQPSRETKATVDGLNAELQQIMVMLGNEDLPEDKKKQAYDRIAEVTAQIVAISKRGDAPVYIINLTPKRWIVNRSHGSFWIPGRQEGKEYSVTEIVGRSAVIDTGRGGEASGRGAGWSVKLDKLYYTSVMLAKDIAREINGDLPALISTRQGTDDRVRKSMGVFMSPTPVPPADMLREEKKIIDQFCAALVAEGNSVWMRTKDYRQMSDLYRFGADYLGISTEWHENLLARMECPGCGEMISKKIAKHITCGAVIDQERARSLGMIGTQSQQPMQGQQQQQRR